MLIEERHGATLVLTLNHPAKRNPLNKTIRDGLLAAFTRAEQDRDIRAIVVTGAGGNFCSGGDIDSMKEVSDLGAGRERFRQTHQLARLMVGGSKPCIAAVEGWAAGAGIALALCCDLVIAAENARFMASFGRIGLVADFGLLRTLPLRVGHGRARNILLTGEAVGAAEAERIGLIDAMVPARRSVEGGVGQGRGDRPERAIADRLYQGGTWGRVRSGARLGARSAVRLAADPRSCRGPRGLRRKAPAGLRRSLGKIEY